MGSVTVGGTNGTKGNGLGIMAAALNKARLLAPRNGIALATLLVGGYKNARHDLETKLRACYGIEVVDHWDMESRTPRTLSFPRGIELCLILSDLLPGGMGQRAVQCCKDAGVPYAYIARHASRWIEPLGALGLESPPLWLRKAPVIEEPTKPVVVVPPPAPYKPPMPAAAKSEPAPAPAAKPPTVPPAAEAKPSMRKVSAFANALRIERERQGLSANALAALVGVGNGSIYNWESGRDITLRSWLKLVDLIPSLRSTPPPCLTREVAALETMEERTRTKGAPEPAKPAPLPAEPHERVLAIAAQAVAGTPVPTPIPPPPPRADTTPAPPADDLGRYMAKLADAERLKKLAAEKRTAAELATREAADAERQLADAIDVAHRMHAEIMERLK
jgi:transcriptional regulator with XRE-family HTH domain